MRPIPVVSPNQTHSTQEQAPSYARSATRAVSAAALQAARVALRCPGEFALVAIRSLRTRPGWTVTDTCDTALSAQAAALMLCLASARFGPDGRPRWMPIGDVLARVSQGYTGPVHRRALRARVRRLRARLRRYGIADLLQTHRTRGLRLAAYPAAIVWSSTTKTDRASGRVRVMNGAADRCANRLKNLPKRQRYAPRSRRYGTVPLVSLSRGN